MIGVALFVVIAVCILAFFFHHRITHRKDKAKQLAANQALLVNGNNSIYHIHVFWYQRIITFWGGSKDFPLADPMWVLFGENVCENGGRGWAVARQRCPPGSVYGSDNLTKNRVTYSEICYSRPSSFTPSVICDHNTKQW